MTFLHTRKIQCQIGDVLSIMDTWYKVIGVEPSIGEIRIYKVEELQYE